MFNYLVMTASNPYSHLRLGVFYDGNFLLHASNYYNYIHSQHSRLSIGGLHEFVRTRAAEEMAITPTLCTITEAHYFRGRINASEAQHRGNQLYNDRVFEDILMAEGVQTHYLPLRNFGGRREERGIDVWLSLEVYQRAIERKIDVAVLVVSDTDYAPLVRKLTELGTPTILLSWEFDYTNDEGVRMVTKTSHELLQQATYPIRMQEEIEQGLRAKDELIASLFVSNEPQRNVRGYDDDDEEDDHRERDEKKVSEILSIKNGYGFIRYPNNNLFFSYQDVIGEFNELEPGDSVEFTLDKNRQGEQVAKNVAKL